MALDLTTFADLFTFSRSGTATYLDSNGVLQTAADGVARTAAYRYVGGVLTGPSLRLESAAATNLLLYSVPTSAQWSEDAGSLSGAISAPDGSTDAKLFTEDGTTALHGLREGVDGGFTSGTTYTASAFLKAGSDNIVQITMDRVDSGSYANFNLSTGAVETIGADADTATIEEIGDGWYRCAVTAPAVSTGTGNIKIYLTNNNASAAREPSYAGDSTGSMNIWSAQLETGSIPTSYIPTSGATATRSAETLTIAAADMPDYQTPTYIGSELVTNGTFDTDTSGWSAVLGATLSVSSGELVVTNDGTGTNPGGAAQSLTTVAGNVYSITVTCTPDGSGHSPRLLVDGANKYQFTPSATPQTVTVTVVATSSSTQITLTNNNTGAGFSSNWDNVSVREVNPLSVCFQMSGAMNYADGGVFAEVRLFQWVADASNNLDVVVSTAASDTGQVFFRQTEGGTQDTVISAEDAYSPGINVSFNISGRHGANFINGAIDGTALTENATPTAIADLSAADFEVGPTFNGHIDQLLIWNQDIGDTGIAESSS